MSLHRAEGIKGWKDFPPPLARNSCSVWVGTKKRVKSLGKSHVNTTVVQDFIFLGFWEVARAPSLVKAGVKLRDSSQMQPSEPGSLTDLAWS